MIPRPYDRTPFEQLGTFFLIWMGCFLFFTLLSAGILLGFFGQGMFEAVASAEQVSRENLNMVRFLQIIHSIGIFGVPPVVFLLINTPPDWTFFRVQKIPPLNLTVLTVVIITASAPVILWALDVNQGMHLPEAFRGLEKYMRDLEEKNQRLLQSMLVMPTVSDFLLNFLMIAIVPAVVEELLFRGTLQQLLHKALGNVHTAIIITGMFFSFIHFQFYGFLPRMMLGVLFGYLFFWSRNLWIPIIAHLLNNGVQVFLLYLFQRGTISINIDEMAGFPPVVTMISTVILFAVVYIFDLITQRQQPSQDSNGKGLG